MKDLNDLIQTFDTHSNWLEFVQENFERKAGAYSYVTVTDIEVIYNNESFCYPKKIVFNNGYIRAQKQISKTEKFLLNKKQIKIIEKQLAIPFSFYERRNKYSGEIYQILNDLLGIEIEEKCKFSPDLLSTRDNPLFSIDSNQKWASYLLILKKQISHPVTKSSVAIKELTDFLSDYGIHYNYEYSLRDLVFVLFPMPYIKIVQNKIVKDENKEFISLVLEYNDLGINYTQQSKIEVEAVIKDINKEIIYNNTILIKYGRVKYQELQIAPITQGNIGFSSILIKINGVDVEKNSGYYIRNIKLDIKAM